MSLIRKQSWRGPAFAGALWLVSSCGGADGGTAQGFGALTPGGSGQPVYHVTNLDDAGEGSLRAAVSEGGRHVLFAVAGTIQLQSEISIRGPYVTIDGSSAPSQGITLRGHGIRADGPQIHDVIIRGIRIRSPRLDGFTIKNGARSILIDHVSVDGCGDGNVDITQGAHDVTVSWSILSSCAKNMLIKFGAARVSLHHNVFVNSQFRNPYLSNHEDGAIAGATTADVRNNLIWGWGNSGGGTGAECGAKANLIGNFYSSPNTTSDRQGKAVILPGCRRGSGALVFTSGNLSADDLPFDLNALGNQASPFPAPPIDTADACQAAREVLAAAGAHPRDAVDQAQLGRISVRCP